MGLLEKGPLFSILVVVAFVLPRVICYRQRRWTYWRNLRRYSEKQLGATYFLSLQFQTSTIYCTERLGFLDRPLFVPFPVLVLFLMPVDEFLADRNDDTTTTTANNNNNNSMCCNSRQ